MTKEYLATLTRKELIDLILQLQASVTEVRGKVTELEAQLASKNPPPKTSSNSSVPPSSQRKGNSRSTRRKKRGEDVFETLQGHIGSPAPVFSSQSATRHPAPVGV